MTWFWLWLGGVIAFLVPIARHFAREFEYGGTVDRFDLNMAVALAFLTAPFWPLLIPGYYVKWMLVKHGQRD